MKTWIMFIVLALIWGSSFLLIKVGLAPEGVDAALVGRFDPVSLATTRLVIAGVLYMGFVLITRRDKLPRSPRIWGQLFIAGLFNSAVPFILISWAEKGIDSGLASVLNGTVPLFSLIMAHLALGDDKITLGKIFGIIAGFCGIVLLATRSTPTHPNPIEGQLAVVVASMSYAFAAVFTRRTFRGLDPYVTGAGTISMGGLICLAILLVAVRPLPNFTAMQPEALRAVITLGIFNTFVAYLLFFSILPVWGASRTTMVTYAMPPIGIILGAIFENELIDWKLIVGALMVVGGVVLANLWKSAIRLPGSKPVAPVVEAKT